MRVLIAPDKFAGTLSAVAAAEAIATGWRRRAPDDELVLAPLSDGGPGFLDVLHAALGGDLRPFVVRGPFGEPTPASVLVAEGTAYVESAQACGRHLTGVDSPAGPTGSPESASSYGVGELVRAAAETGVSRIVLGLGGSGTSDGGAGMLAALGARADRPLDAGAAGLAGITTFTAPPPLPAAPELIAATDVDVVLTGLFGAVKGFGPQKGIAEDRLVVVDGWLEEYAAVAGRRAALEKGAGAAGGLGYALLLLGGRRVSGIDLVAEAVGLADAAGVADLVVTGEGSFDFSSRAGKVPAGVAATAERALRPCVVLAGRVSVGSREMRALGVESAYSCVELVGEEAALADPAGSLAALAERVARTWSRG